MGDGQPGGRSAWTASVWGGGGGQKDGENVLQKGDESCPCCLETPVEVKLHPCEHAVCLVCCGRMRSANIFKVGWPQDSGTLYGCVGGWGGEAPALWDRWRVIGTGCRATRERPPHPAGRRRHQVPPVPAIRGSLHRPRRVSRDRPVCLPLPAGAARPAGTAVPGRPCPSAPCLTPFPHPIPHSRSNENTVASLRDANQAAAISKSARSGSAAASVSLSVRRRRRPPPAAPPPRLVPWRPQALAWPHSRPLTPTSAWAGARPGAAGAAHLRAPGRPAVVLLQVQARQRYCARRVHALPQLQPRLGQAKHHQGERASARALVEARVEAPHPGNACPPAATGRLVCRRCALPAPHQRSCCSLPRPPPPPPRPSPPLPALPCSRTR
jgi:hypothetical protein